MATHTAPPRRRPTSAKRRPSRRAAAEHGADGEHVRSDWKGHIAFGLVEIPVALRTAERRSRELHFSLIDRRDRAPVGNLRVNKVSGEEVPWSEIVKGYEHEKGEYVLLDESELRRANVEASRTIEIRDFVDAAAIDPVYFSEPYHVLPARAKGNRAYALLHAALEKSGKVGIATVVLRTREHLAALTTRGPLLALLLMRWGHDLVPAEEVKLPADSLSGSVSARELAMAQQLVESMSSDWKPGAYKDTYHEDIMALIQRKVRSGQTGPVSQPEAEEGEEPAAPVLDLMPLLQQSLGPRGRRTATRAKPRPRAHRKSA
jgi:DNA end-binding protein Ku